MSGDILNSACRFLVEYGYLPKDHAVSSFDDLDFKAAVAKFQRFDKNVELAAEEHGEDLVPDGNLGPATLRAMSLPRCACPDNDAFEPLVGTGGWQNCHGADGMHHAIVLVDPRNKPSFLESLFEDILRRVQKAYAEIGLLFRFCESQNGPIVDLLTGERVTPQGVNIDFTFTRGNGWIGLAIVGNGSNQQCASKIWAQFEYRYQPRDIVNEWVTLIKHELGHNCGLRHTSGGVMNPGIINGLPNDWVSSDPSTRTLKKWFGGEPVEIPGAPDDPEPPPSPPGGGDRPDPGSPLGTPFTWHDGTRCQVFRIMGGK